MILASDNVQENPMPIVLILVLALGIVLGWAISRKWIAAKLQSHLAHLDRPFNSQVTRQTGKSIARIVGA
jgi:hypothetical protein